MNISLRTVNISDAKYLFELANDPVARSSSFTTHEISWDEHINWFKGKLSNPDFYMYIFVDEDKNVGVVRIEKKEETIIGVTVDPNYRGKGIGSEIIKLACQEYWKTNDEDIIAYIKNTNTASLKSFTKALFIFKTNTQVNGIDSTILIARK